LPTATPTPTVTPTATPLPAVFVVVNEVLPAPQTVDWDGSGVADAEDEYIELYNPLTEAVDLTGWLLDDAEGGSRPYRLPMGTAIGPRGFLLVFRRESRIVLNNEGDEVRLLTPGGMVVDRFVYGRSRPDTAWSRREDGGEEWTDEYPPSPGRPNRPAEPTATPTPRPMPPDGAITLNELLPAPRAVDWDGNGVADHTDEWVELYNSSALPIDLSDWRLWKGAIAANGLPDGFFYAFPEGSLLPPYTYLVVFYRQSRLSLPNTDGQLHLVRPDGRIVDSFAWISSPGYDRSFSRYPDGYGTWGIGDVTAGLPNHPHPPPASPPASGPTATPVPDPGLGVGVEPIARAYELAQDTRMTVEGMVTVPPGLFGSRVLYLQDESGGLRIYLRSGEYPAIALGDRIRVTGYIRTFYGHRELNVPGPRWLVWLGHGTVPRPRFLRTGQIGSPFEGRLVIVTGAVVGFRDNHFWLDDGSGQVRVTVDSDLAWRRPYFRRDSIWTVIGIVGRYNDFYRLLPRYPTDIGPAPGLLPMTGGNSGANASAGP
jgi:hypothetical protein